MRVLVVNTGSSSLKLRLLDRADQLEQSADLPADGDGFDPDRLRDTIADWMPPDAVGHRVVHGGVWFTGPTLIDGGSEARLRELSDLAPLHQPKSLAAVDAVTALLPDTPAVACFDTAFHHTLPDEAATYAIPRDWRQRYHVRRYGFHGLSHAYCARRVGELLGGPVSRLVICHLGAGASLAAVLDGRSVDTTMGFTPLEGLVMATRSGSVDPGLVLWLTEHEGLPPHEVAEALEHRSGLAALAGTADLRQVEAAAGQGDPDARLALDVYLHRLVTGVASMTAATGGLDALVFTGGVGENSTLVRQRAGERLGYLGVSVDPARNTAAALSSRADTVISPRGAPVRTLVVHTREDLEIAREVRDLLGTPGSRRER